MMSMHIMDSDAFLDMPHSTQNLYMHMLMRADDDGFVSNPKKISRMIGANDDDIRILFSKRFVIPFENGVCVIKHWKIHNYIQKDRYQPTKYTEEMGLLKVKDNGGYTLDTECIQNGDTGKVRLGKSKVRKELNTETKVPDGDKKLGTLIGEVIKLFESVDPKNKKYYNNPTQRAACEFLLSEYGLEEITKHIEVLPKTNTMPYFPNITTPCQLRDKWVTLNNQIERHKAEQGAKSNTVAF